MAGVDQDESNCKKAVIVMKKRTKMLEATFLNVKIKTEDLRSSFENGLRKETEILVEKHFRPFVFYFNIQKCCFWLYHLPLN